VGDIIKLGSNLNSCTSGPQLWFSGILKAAVSHWCCQLILLDWLGMKVNISLRILPTTFVHVACRNCHSYKPAYSGLFTSSNKCQQQLPGRKGQVTHLSLVESVCIISSSASHGPCSLHIGARGLAPCMQHCHITIVCLYPTHLAEHWGSGVAKHAPSSSTAF